MIFLCSIRKYTVIVCFLLRDYSTYTTCSQVVQVMYVMPTAADSSINPHFYSLCNCNQSDQPQKQRSVMFIPCIIYTLPRLPIILHLYCPCVPHFPIFIDAASRYQLWPQQSTVANMVMAIPVFVRCHTSVRCHAAARKRHTGLARFKV